MNRNLRLIAGAVTTLVTGFAALAGWQWQTALSRLEIVQSEALAADARRLALQEPFLAIKTAIAAFTTSDSPDAETALLEGISRIPALKMFLPCAEGHKAVGVAFSGTDQPLLGYACLAYRAGGQETTLKVVDLDGANKYAATVAGDARNFSFIDSTNLHLEISGRPATLDLRTGQVTTSSSQPPPAPPIASQRAVLGKLDEVGARCIQRHPYSTRYFAAAPSPDGHLLAYTTEANQIVIADLTTGECVGDPLEAHTHNLLAMAWGASGRYLASAGAIADGDNGHGVALWDREQISSFARVIYQSKRLNGSDPKFALSADGSSWICGACDDRVRWNGQPLDLPNIDDLGAPSAIALKPDGKEAAIAHQGVIHVIRRKNNGFSVERKSAPTTLIHALTYVNDSLYAEDEKLGIWNLSGLSSVKTNTVVSDSADCFDDQPAGPYFLSEALDHRGSAHLKLADLKSGEITDVPVPSDAQACAAVTFSPGALIAVRTTAAYRPFLVARLSSVTDIQTMSNPLRQSAGLQTVLRSARLSYDGRRLIASSDNSGLAIFDLAAKRLIGSINLGEVRHVALAADGKVALVEGGGKILSLDLDPPSWHRRAKQITADSVPDERTRDPEGR